MGEAVQCFIKVSIHARAWRATFLVKGGNGDYKVSIHARAWRATSTRFARQICDDGFNSRPRVAGDPPRQASRQTIDQFQFTPARGGRPGGYVVRCDKLLFQFTPARGGRPSAESDAECGERFNSRPRVAGDTGAATAAPMAAFQFTPARGGRPVPEVGADGLVAVSIHARAWRATRSHAEGDAANPFQFTPARGGRRSHAESDAVHHPFQFTPARGGRRPDHRAAPAHRWFQFTPARGGRRWLPTPANPRDFVSIHARAWRATPDIEQRTRAHRVSIHARAWRATAVVEQSSQIKARFNSRPRVAGDGCRGGGGGG